MNNLSQTRRIYLFRHGETDWNRIRRLQGANDIPLNEVGRQQAMNLRNFFQKNPVNIYFSSPLKRAKDTLQLACEVDVKQINILPDLAEVRLGALEGLLESEMNEKFSPEEIFRWRNQQDATFAFPGAECAEESNKRFKNALHKIIQSPFEQAAAVCTHGFLMNRFLKTLSQRPIDFRVPNAQIFTLTWRTLAPTSNQEVDFQFEVFDP